MKILSPKIASFAGTALLCAVFILILAVNTARFYKLNDVPYGFHVDELSDAVTIGCLGTEGVDAFNRPYPLFGELGYGSPKPPVYMYPAVLWGKIFDYSVPSLRMFSAAFFTLGLIGLFFLSRFFFGSRFALWTVLTASISPSVWVISRVAFESLFAVTFLLWGTFFLLRFRNIAAGGAAGVLLSCAMYAYPPFRLFVPLFLLTLWLYAHQTQRIAFKVWAALAGAITVVSIPLIRNILDGGVQSRFNQISIAAPDYLRSLGKTNSIKDLSEIFLNNFGQHLSVQFLFVSGDPSHVHSTQYFGFLGWLDILGLAFLLFLAVMVLMKRSVFTRVGKKDGAFVAFAVANIFLGIVPSAMTNSELPNALRIIGAWPFVCLLTGYAIWRMSERWPLVITALSLATALVFSWTLVDVYFKKYPMESAAMFSFWTKAEADQAKTDDEWLNFVSRYRNDNFHSRYFLMNYRGEGCRESKRSWDELRPLWQYLKI
jgi:hypothetical protein